MSVRDLCSFVLMSSFYWTALGGVNFATRNVTHFNPLQPGTFVIMRNKTHEYIGEVLDVYKKGSSGRHGSVAAAPSTSGLSYLSLRVYLPMQTVSLRSVVSLYKQVLMCPSFPQSSLKLIYDASDYGDTSRVVSPPFTCRQHTFDLHTHAPINHLVFNLGKRPFTTENDGMLMLSEEAARHWISLTSVRALQLLPKLKIRLPRTGN